jgi:hypothetical protein
MVAEFKSHILSRDEKGFAGVPFKRLMLAGVGGGFSFMLGRFALPDVALPAALLVGLLLVILTAPRGGIPRWSRMLYHVRGSLMLAAAYRPASLGGRLGRLIEIPIDLAHMDADRLFRAPDAESVIDLAEWVTFARAADADRGDGLEFVEAREWPAMPA